MKFIRACLLSQKIDFYFVFFILLIFLTFLTISPPSPPSSSGFNLPATRSPISIIPWSPG